MAAVETEYTILAEKDYGEEGLQDNDTNQIVSHFLQWSVGLDDSAFSKFYIYTSMIKAASKNIDYITVAYEVRGNLQTTWSPPPPISHRNNNAQFLSSLLCKSRQKMLQYFTKEMICTSITNSTILSLSPNLKG